MAGIQLLQRVGAFFLGHYGAFGGFNQHSDLIRFVLRGITLNGKWRREAWTQVGTGWCMTLAGAMTVRQREKWGAFRLSWKDGQYHA